MENLPESLRNILLAKLLFNNGDVKEESCCIKSGGEGNHAIFFVRGQKFKFF